MPLYKKMLIYNNARRWVVFKRGTIKFDQWKLQI